MRTVYTCCLMLLLTACSGSSGSPDVAARADSAAAPDEIVTNSEVRAPELVADIGADAPEAATEVVLHDAAPDLKSAPDVAPDVVGTDAVDTSEELELPPPIDELVENWPFGEIEKQCGKGVLGSLQSPSGEISVMVLRGGHYNMGYQAGCLIGGRTGKFFANFMSYFLDEIEDAAEEMGIDPQQASALLYAMVNNVWQHVDPFVHEKYKQEMIGFQDAVMEDPEAAAFWTDVEPEWGLKTLVLLSNISDLNWSGSMEDVLDKLANGFSPSLKFYYDEDTAALLLEYLVAYAKPKWPALPLRTSCSFFAAWGPRTADGHLVGSRNLDWSTDTGISQLKGITVFAPDGEYAHAAIGYLGFPGALAGMSEKGIILSEVGSESAMERLKGQPWTLKFRDIMESAGDLDSATQIALGTYPDGHARPVTIGYNWMVAFGDPPSGKNSAAAALETNGLVAGMHRSFPDCETASVLVQYDLDGNVAMTVNNDLDPVLANLEADAVEINADGEPRLFAVDAEGQFVLDDNGYPVADPVAGQPYPVAKTLPCAIYRGDEALMHGVRMWQTAANGPQGGDKLIVSSGSYRHRYTVMHDILQAWETGGSYDLDGETYVEGTGQPVPVGLLEAEKVARAAAMGSNVLAVAYDATALKIRVSYEIGTGDTWQGAHKHDFVEIDLKSVFDLL